MAGSGSGRGRSRIRRRSASRLSLLGWALLRLGPDLEGVPAIEDANHGFHNDTAPRYNEKATCLAQERTIAFFNEHLGG